MKKNSIYAFMLVIGLILSACGSNSKPDGTGGSNTKGTITTTLQNITVDKNSGNIAANVRVTSTYESSVVATLNSMDISLGGCSLVSGSVSANPDTVSLDSTTPSKDVVLTGTLTDPSCVPTSYQLSGTNTLAADGQTATRSFTTARVDVNATSIIDGTLKSVLTIIDPASKNLDINTSNVEKSVIVHLALGKTALANEKIKINNSVTNGSFFTSTVVTDEQGNATFAYRAPDTITDSSFDVKFCMESDNAVCDSVTINLTTGTITPPDNNDTPDVGNDFVNYGMTFVTADGGNTLGLDERKLYVVSLIDKDTQTVIPANQVEKITIESNKPDVLKLIDPSDAVGAAVGKLEITGKSSINLYLKAAKEISGLSDIKITINYKNKKGFARVLTKTYAITVLSGPPTALSITDAGTAYNPDTKWFEQKFLISASDKYNNNINTSPTISVGVMAGYAKDANGDRIIYGQNTPAVYANVTENNQVNLDVVGKAPFSAFDPVSLKGIDLNRDIVAIFGNVRTYEVNGKWEIDSISSASKLILSDTYEGENYTALGFAVGHNYRNDICSDEYLEYETKVDSTDGTYRLDAEGKTFVTVKYPAAYMPGKRVGILVNLISENPETGKQLRGGEVKFETLHKHSPFGLTGITKTITKGTTETVTLYGTVETGTEDTWVLMNSTFSCEIKKSKNITIISLEKNDPNACVRPYVRYKVTTSNNGEDGTFVLSDCEVDKEFSF